MKNIIGFCGRCQSGKSELANICTKFNYKKISFATPLKELIANLLNCTVDDVNKLKTANFKFICDEEKCKLISIECDIPLNIINETLLNKEFNNTRQMLQFIGTNVIRNYNNNWHVNKIKKIIKPHVNYVIDDVRFQNEANLINELNGDLWFVVRPKFDNISNHESETTLKWQMFKNIIINDGNLKTLTDKWTNFMTNDYFKQMKKKNNLEHKLNAKTNMVEDLINDKLNTKEFEELFINKELFTYKSIIYDTKKAFVENNKIIAILNDNTKIEVKHPLEIEDMKIIL